MKLLFFLLFCLPVVVLGNVNLNVEVKDKFTTSDKEEIQKGLLLLASEQAVLKIASEKSINFDQLRSKLDKKFKEYLSRFHAKKLSEKFGSKYSETLSPEIKKEYLASLKINESDLFKSFAGYSYPIKSHQFKEFKLRSDSSDQWEGLIELNVDSNKMDNLFKSILNDDVLGMPKVFIMSDIEADSFTWPEMNLTDSKKFLGPINSSWLEWIKDNYSQVIADVKICDQKCMNFYQEWVSAEASLASIPLEYFEASFLRIDFNLKRTKLDPIFHEIGFSWEGRVILQDINTKKIMSNYSMPLEKRFFRSLDQRGLNSAIASQLYRAPFTAFLQLQKQLESKQVAGKLGRVLLKGLDHLGDVFAFIDHLKVRGSSLGLEVSLEGFSKNEAFLTCFYKGEEKSFSDLLSGLKEIKLRQPYQLIGEFTGVQYTINFMTESSKE